MVPILGFKKQIWWRLVFHLFGSPFVKFLLGKWAKVEYLTDCLVVSLHFCCINKYHFIIKNIRGIQDPEWCCRWWDLVDWQWKVGFMPRAIRHGPPCLQIESSGVMNSYLWVLSLEFTNLVGHTQFTFLKYPCLGPPSTPSDRIMPPHTNTQCTHAPSHHGQARPYINTSSS